MKNIIKYLSAFAVITGLASLYWRKIFLFYFPGEDEWALFSELASLTDKESLIRFFFEPVGSQHFMPLFKLLYYLEFSFFGLNPLPYHWVTLMLFSASLMVFYRFIFLETKATVSSIASTFLLGIVSVYYPILMWMIHHDVMLSFIFLIFALIQVSRYSDKGKTIDFLKVGILCLISAMFYPAGIASGVMAGIFYLLKHFSLSSESRINARGFITRLLLVLSPVIIVFSIFYLYIFTSNFIQVHTLVFKPFQILWGSFIIAGNLMLETLGIDLMDAIANAMGIDIKDFYSSGKAMRAFEVISIGAILVTAISSVLIFRKQGKTLRLLMLTGVIFTLVFTSLFVAGRWWLYGGAVQITNIPRYNFFPFIGLSILVASVLSHLHVRYGKHFLIVSVVVLLVLSFVHQRAISGLALQDAQDINDRKFLISLLMNEAGGTQSKYVGKYRELWIADIPPEKLFSLFKGQDDVITKTEKGVLLLKDFTTLGAKNIEIEGKETAFREGKLRISSSSSLRIGIIPDSPEGMFQHLFFRMRSNSESQGTLYFTLNDGSQRQGVFLIQPGWSYKQYVIPCPDGVSMGLVLGRGDFRIKDLRLYH